MVLLQSDGRPAFSPLLWLTESSRSQLYAGTDAGREALRARVGSGAPGGHGIVGRVPGGAGRALTLGGRWSVRRRSAQSSQSQDFSLDDEGEFLVLDDIDGLAAGRGDAGRAKGKLLESQDDDI